MIIMASASGTPVPAIARLVQADEDTVRQVIHRFNEIGLAYLDPQTSVGSWKLKVPQVKPEGPSPCFSGTDPRVRR